MMHLPEVCHHSPYKMASHCFEIFEMCGVNELTISSKKTENRTLVKLRWLALEYNEMAIVGSEIWLLARGLALAGGIALAGGLIALIAGLADLHSFSQRDRCLD